VYSTTHYRGPVDLPVSDGRKLHEGENVTFGIQHVVRGGGKARCVCFKRKIIPINRRGKQK
jgi:hypothetical protein